MNNKTKLCMPNHQEDKSSSDAYGEDSHSLDPKVKLLDESHAPVFVLNSSSDIMKGVLKKGANGEDLRIDDCLDNTKKKQIIQHLRRASFAIGVGVNTMAGFKNLNKK